MGFFSWRTADTDRSIPNRYSGRDTFTVYMRDHKGNMWIEDKYEGYGVFAGKDYYELLAEMNLQKVGSTLVRGDSESMSLREIGLWMEFESGLKTLRYPMLFQNINSTYFDSKKQKCDSCYYQGFFYGSEL